METSRPETIESTRPGGDLGRPYLPPIDDAELARRNQVAMRLLDAWAQDEVGEEDQRETLAVLKVALGEGRIASSRDLFP